MTAAQITASIVIGTITCVAVAAILFARQRNARLGPPPIPRKLSRPNDLVLPTRPAWAFVVGLVGMVTWFAFLVALEPVGFDPLAATPRDIRSVSLTPGPDSRFSLVQAPIVLSPDDISGLCAHLNGAQRYQPNHPSTKWSCELLLQANGKTETLEVSATGGGVVMITWLSPNIRFRRDTFRCDALAPLLEAIASKRNSTSGPAPPGSEARP